MRWDANSAEPVVMGNLGTTSSGYTTGNATAINNAGFSVGSALKCIGGAPVNYSATLWNPHGDAFDLNTFIDPGSGWRLEEADSISDTGFIAGVGLLIPTGSARNRHTAAPSCWTRVQSFLNPPSSCSSPCVPPSAVDDKHVRQTRETPFWQKEVGVLGSREIEFSSATADQTCQPQKQEQTKPPTTSQGARPMDGLGLTLA